MLVSITRSVYHLDAMAPKLCDFRSAVTGVRYFRKGTLRKPLRVITEHGNVLPSGETEFEKRAKSALPVSVEHKKSEKLNIPSYIKLGDKDGEFLKIVSQLRSRKQRDKTGKVLLEGKRLIIDAIDAGSKVESIFFSKEETLIGIPFEKIPDVKIMKVFYKKLSIWSSLITSPGIMGVCKKPDYKMMFLTKNTFPLTVICDNVRDPGNMGSILRCAAAVGCCRILLTKGCVDIWEPKVLRAACGAHFHISVLAELSWDTVINYIPENAQVFLADNSSDDDCVTEEQQILDECVQQQRFVEKEDVVILKDTSYEDKEVLKRYQKLHLPQYEYTKIKYDKECVLVIGGETEGLSAQSFKLASEYNGCRVNIPTENNVESLNTSISIAIIVYEMRRQICNKEFSEKE